jgi:hypothetical protein
MFVDVMPASSRGAAGRSRAHGPPRPHATGARPEEFNMIARILGQICRACLVPALLAPTACARTTPDQAAAPSAAVTLPDAPELRAMTCYAAEVVAWDGQGHAAPLSDVQAGRAAHFVLLGAANGPTIDADKIMALPAQAGPIKTKLRAEQRDAAYRAACTSGFPMTAAGHLPPLASDSSGVRMQCFALAWAMTQIYANSPTVEGPRIARARRVADILDEQLSRELEAGEGASRQAMETATLRALAGAIRQGPVTEMIDACAARYAPDRS